MKQATYRRIKHAGRKAAKTAVTRRGFTARERALWAFGSLAIPVTVVLVVLSRETLPAVVWHFFALGLFAAFLVATRRMWRMWRVINSALTGTAATAAFTVPFSERNAARRFGRR